MNEPAIFILHFYRINATAKLKTAHAMTLIGTATISKRLNRTLRSVSSPQEPMISEPPEEKGLIALD